MACSYDIACRPQKSGVCEQRFEVTPGEHGIKMDVKLNVGVIPMSGFGDRKVLGAVEEIKLINWPEGLDGRIEVRNAYCDEDDACSRVPYDTEFKGSPPKNLLERPIAYKRVVDGNGHTQTTSMCIQLSIYWLHNVSRQLPKHTQSLLSPQSNPDPDLKLKSSDNVCLYLKGDRINGFSPLLKRYREGNYDQKMSKSDDGCFECPEFNTETLWVLFYYGQYKCIPYYHILNIRFVDVMRAADFFGANRACGELFAMETRRLIYKGGTKDNGCGGTKPMSAREYLDLWQHAINYNAPKVVQMLARHTHWFIDEMQTDQEIWDEYCKFLVGGSE